MESETSEMVFHSTDMIWFWTSCIRWMLTGLLLVLLGLILWTICSLELTRRDVKDIVLSTLDYSGHLG